MAKYLLRLKARELRKKGVSVKEIAKHLMVSKATASIWVRDIILTIEQLEALKKSSLLGAERGRLKNALLQKKKWNDNLENEKLLAAKIINNLTSREFLIAGLALYWGEGSRKVRRVEFCNSDPKMVQFLISWLRQCFNIQLYEITCCIGINEIHRDREQLVKEYWSKISGIPLVQFRKTSFKKAQSKKVYENFHDHYGTFVVRVLQPSRFYVKILGLIDGLSEAGVKLRLEQNYMPT